ncbi:putative inner membrane transporter YedA [Pirellula sp. SH-Sr6A]|uniref:EamA family transporter n=1 Tax=Pirellula sp. SH-Sr6A TaxID=1632865 RepID=UPI00078B27FD|nr:EamA family transporter [Pirellula sp. SH-Sr6A]AMV31871.1 putative inner membrane transporter YedA [Pirellula sp. SH-Sr6A]
MSGTNPNNLHEKRPPALFIAGGLGIIYLVWGSTYLAIKVAVDTLPPFLMAGARFLVAGAVMAVILLAFGRLRATGRQWLWNAWVGLFMMVGGNGLVSWAEQTIPSGIATLIVAFNPLMMVTAEWVIWGRTKGKLGASPNRTVFAGLAMGCAGLAMLVAPSLQGTGSASYDLLRVGAIVLACLTWTIGSMMTRYGGNPTDPFTGAAIQMLCGGLWLIAFGALLGETKEVQWTQFSRESIFAWWYLVIAGSLVAFTTFVWLMKHASPTLISTYAYVNPVVAVFLGWLVLNERIDNWTIVSAAVIVLGVATITWGKRPRVVSSK